MIHQAFLAACYMLGVNYHTGQWSKGYRLLCLADQRAKREHSAWNVGRTVDQLAEHKLYPKGCEFRNNVAYFLRRMRKHRFSL